MIKVQKIEVFNIDGALRGMRNSWDSHEKSDSGYKKVPTMKCSEDNKKCDVSYSDEYVIGDNDMALCKKLIAGGTEHRKWARQIMISMDITAPLYWWKEYDTYKVGTTSNSDSTMHTIARRDLTVDDFSIDKLTEGNKDVFLEYINKINSAIAQYRQNNNRNIWHNIIQMLPSSFNQKRTVTFNYENAFNMIHQRKLHKLPEWQDFCNELTKLPYISEFMEEEIKNLEVFQGLGK